METWKHTVHTHTAERLSPLIHSFSSSPHPNTTRSNSFLWYILLPHFSPSPRETLYAMRYYFIYWVWYSDFKYKLKVLNLFSILYLIRFRYNDEKCNHPVCSWGESFKARNKDWVHQEKHHDTKEMMRENVDDERMRGKKNFLEHYVLLQETSKDSLTFLSSLTDNRI